MKIWCIQTKCLHGAIAKAIGKHVIKSCHLGEAVALYYQYSIFNKSNSLFQKYHLRRLDLLWFIWVRF